MVYVFMVYINAHGLTSTSTQGLIFAILIDRMTVIYYQLYIVPSGHLYELVISMDLLYPV